MQDRTMDQYLIGAGAVLTAGPEASIVGATLHAQTDPLLAANVSAALLDFESLDCADLSQIVVMVKGWKRSQFQDAVVAPLLRRRECSLADVVVLLARAAGSAEVHVFSRWEPDQALLVGAQASGVRLVIHPLECIEQAALVSGQRVGRWRAPFRAA